MELSKGIYINTSRPLYLEDGGSISLVEPNVEGLVRLTEEEFVINWKCNPDILKDDWYKCDPPNLTRIDQFKKYGYTMNPRLAMGIVYLCKDTELRGQIKGIPESWWEVY